MLAVDEVAFLGAIDALDLMRRRALSPVELLDAVIARIERDNATVNALTHVPADEARDAARLAEDRYAGKGDPPRALEGLPVAVKDEVPIAGMPWTEGSLVHADRVATFTSPLAQRILDAGGIVHARTTTPEFCVAGFTHSALWGVTRNPWAPELSCGGSSGGSAAALAAGFTTLATGSDIGGSIRVPAATCGVVGFRPPFGRVPELPPFNLDHYNQNGPMARSVTDAALLANVISGPHPSDIATVRPKLELPLELGDVRGLRVGICVELGGYTIDDDVRSNTLDVAAALAECGAELVEVELPWDPEATRELAFAHFGLIAGPIVLGHIDTHPELVSDYVVAFARQAAAAAERIPAPDGFAREGEHYAQLARVFERCDGLVCPTMGVAGLPAGDSFVDAPPVIAGIQLDDYMDAFLTMGFSITGRCPVLAVPSGRDHAGVPTGVQIVGRTFEDRTVYEIAASLESARPWNYPGEVS